MKTAAAKSAPDDIDRIVDDLLADPTRADDIKLALRRRLSGTPAIPRAVPTVPAPAEQPAWRAAADDDDLWENMPV